MTTLSPLQQKTLDKVSTWIQEFFSHVPFETLDNEPGFGLFMGSAWVEVSVQPWKEDTVINVSSNVVSGATIDQELLQFLLHENNELVFGAFSMTPEGDIYFQHTIVGATCDPEELQASVNEVLEVADEYDDRIVAKWGGQRALDKPCLLYTSPSPRDS